VTDFQTFFGYFHVFQVVEHARTRMITFKNKTLEQKIKTLNFWSILPKKRW
jgi:hypothetical protein